MLRRVDISGARGPSCCRRFRVAASYISSVDEISKDATGIAIVEIRSISNEVYAQTPFTIAEAVVVEVVKASSSGALTVGGSIVIGEMGGPIRAESKTNPGEFGKVSIMAVGGVQPIAAGETYLMFFDGPARIGPVMEGAYVPIGAFQGKILLAENGKLEFTGDNRSFSEPEFAVQKALNGRKWADVKLEIVAALVTAP